MKILLNIKKKKNIMTNDIISKKLKIKGYLSIKKTITKCEKIKRVLFCNIRKKDPKAIDFFTKV